MSDSELMNRFFSSYISDRDRAGWPTTIPMARPPDEELRQLVVAKPNSSTFSVIEWEPSHDSMGSRKKRDGFRICLGLCSRHLYVMWPSDASWREYPFIEVVHNKPLDHEWDPNVISRILPNQTRADNPDYLVAISGVRHLAVYLLWGSEGW